MDSHHCMNFVNGQSCRPVNGQYGDVISPADGSLIAKVPVSSRADLDKAVECAANALPNWRGLTMRARSALMFRLHSLLTQKAEELAAMVSLEHGKNIQEAKAEVAKGIETVEWACGLPQNAQTRSLQVSRGVVCQDQLEPVGIVGCIVPFNFPIMVPLWTIPIALGLGNCVILKPSEKVPMTMSRFAEIVKEAGFPNGVFQIVHGEREIVEGLCDHNGIQAVTFVGSSKVAEIVYRRCHSHVKRVLALGGAKNHLVALPDCDLKMTALDITGSFTGCSGQRCMASSVLLVVGEQPELIANLVLFAKQIEPGQGPGQMGPVIDNASKQRIVSMIDEAENSGAKILLDGRDHLWTNREGHWVGPTVILHTNQQDRALHEEIFGPVISILIVSSKAEAISIENECPYGNAACVYTSSPVNANWFADRFRAGMVGVNIGVPVPREPFSFGGLYGTLSKFGEHDITGDGCVNFLTNRKKTTTKWSVFHAPEGKQDLSQFK